MIKTYLFELLKVNSRVIIPDLGAFLVKEKPGGKMEVSFNDFLKFNDGLLVNKIIKIENISKTDATKKIKEFIKEIEGSIKTGRFTIENVGTFYKDDFGRIKFDPYKEEKAKETKQPEEIKEDKTEVKKAEVKADGKKEDKVGENKEVKEKKEKEVEKTKVKEETKVEKVVKAEEKKEELKEAKPEKEKIETEIKSTEQITAKVAKEPAKKEEVIAEIVSDSEMVVAKHTKPKGSATLVWISAIVVVVAVIITWAVLDYDRIKGWFDGGEQEVVETNVEVTPAETVAKETKVVDEETMTDKKEVVEEVIKEEEPVKETVPEPVYKESKYYVIAGSFKVESNAINYHKRLINKGYNSENLGLVNGFHMVTFSGFENLEDAVKMLKMVKAEQPDAWVMKH